MTTELKDKVDMFCYQCEQAAAGTGCTKRGVCGKTSDVAAMQDVLVEVTKGISMYAHRAAALGQRDPEIDVFVIEALFTTVTNVNFDAERIFAKVKQALSVREKAQALYKQAANAGGQQAEQLGGPAVWQPANDLQDAISQAGAVGIARRRAEQGDDVTALEELLVYGLKGAAAYADHAHVLGQDDPEIYAAFHEGLDFVAAGGHSVDELVGKCLWAGELNLKVMGLLDKANTETYGHPEPTQVRVTPVAGKAIVVSGHDLKDLKALLEQTEGKGVNVYTHGEMLPCHAYPELKKHKHLVGNYGGAWQNQWSEFAAFPGAILMTTNCIQEPKDEYKGRIFTSGLVAWPGVTHIDDGDFTPVIEAALAAPGFAEDTPEQTITVGFGHQATLSVADKVVEAVKSGDIRHFFLVGGCDGARPGRNYYTEFAEQVPDDCVILTLACGKFRFNKKDFGDIGGIPRLLDVGQCNDAYSAVQIAVALAKAFDCGVNDLPLSLIVSWYEQKAVAILLTLLHLGIKDIRLGPTLPAFVTQPILEALVTNFDLKAISTPEEDLAACLG